MDNVYTLRKGMDEHYELDGQLFEWDVERAAANLRKHRVSFEQAPAGPLPRRGGTMKMAERIEKRLRKERPMTTISIRLPEDVIEDLKLIAPALGFSGYQPLIRAYIGQGLRKDLSRLENDQMQAVAESLRRRGISDHVIAEAFADARAKK